MAGGTGCITAMITWFRDDTRMQTQSNYLNEKEYLAIERKAPYKSEYFGGKMLAISGARRAHSLILVNLGASLHAQLRSRPFEVYLGDMRVHASAKAKGFYTYPDVSVVNSQPHFADGQFDTLLNPVFLAEVLSESTERYDRGRKFELYQSIPSLSEYLLVASDHIRVDLYTRQANGKWLLTSASSLEETLAIDSMCCKLSLADLYDKVQFEEGAEDQNRFL